MRRKYVVAALKNTGWETRPSPFPKGTRLHAQDTNWWFTHPRMTGVTVTLGESDLSVSCNERMGEVLSLKLSDIVSDSTGWFRAGLLGFRFDEDAETARLTEVPKKVLDLHDYLVEQWQSDRDIHMENIIGMSIPKGDEPIVTKENVVQFLYYDLDDVPDANDNPDIKFTYGSLITTKRALDQLYILYPQIPGRVNLFATKETEDE